VERGTHVRTLAAASEFVVRIAFLSGGKRLLVHASERPLRILDFATGQELAAWTVEGTFESVAASADGRTVISGHGDGSIRSWDLAGRSRILVDPLHPQYGDRRVLGVALSPDSRTVAAAYAYGRVRVFETATGSERFAFPGHSEALRVAFSPDGTRLASSGSDRVLVIWDVTGTRLPSAAPPKDLDAAWADLMHRDADRGLAAIRYFVDHPGPGVKLLAEKLTPAPPIDAKAVAALIDQLGSSRFAVRERASRELAALGEAAAGPLREAEATTSSAEVRQRLDPLLAALWQAKPTGEPLRTLRAVEALERLGTADARRVLTTLASGEPGSAVTRDAKAALERLGPR
jgi:hypothetical protein